MNKMSKKYLFVLNPHAGAGFDKADIIQKLESIRPDIHLTTVETTGENDASMVSREIDNNNWDAVLVGGGDGTVNLAAKILTGRNVPLGIVPLGSANGLAACLDIFDIDAAIEAIRSGNTTAMDVLNINDELCLHLSDFGFNAGLVKRFDERDKRGILAYFASSLEEFSEMRPFHFEIKIEEESVHTVAKMLVIANGDRYGTGAIINPEGKIDDGVFEIIALNPEGLSEMVALSIDFFRGTIHQSSSVKIWKAKRAEISNPDNAPFQIDGEVIDKTQQISVHCKKAVLTVFVPG
jgi:diacylglycerol kinase (ATP)